jgi:hypothetical protein
MPLEIREHRSPCYNFNHQSTGASVARRRPFEGECAAGRPGRLPAQPRDRAPWQLYLLFRCYVEPGTSLFHGNDQIDHSQHGDGVDRILRG